MINLRTNAAYIKQLSSDVLAIIESESRYFLVDIEQKKALSNTKIEGIHAATKTLEIIKNGEYLFCLDEARYTAKVIRLIDLKEINSFNPTKALIDVICASSDGEILVIGGNDGKSFMFEFGENHPKELVSSHKDAITAIAISENKEYVATAGQDRVIFLKNITRHEMSEPVLKLKNTPTALQFFKDRYLLCGDRNGEIVLVDFIQKKIIFEYESINSAVIDIVILEERYMIIKSKNGKLNCFDIVSNELLSDDFLSFDRRYSVVYYDKDTKTFSLGSNSSKIFAYSLEFLEETLDDAVKSMNIKELYEIVNINPTLKSSKSYLSFEALWEVTYAEAKSLIEEGKSSEANNLLRAYVAIPQKRMMIQKLVEHMGMIPQLKNAIKNRHFSKAYSIASSYPIIKSSTTFKRLEEFFKDTLLKALEHVKSSRIDKANKILFSFKSVTEKSKAIRSIFQDANIIDKAIKAAEEEDFAEFFHYCSICEAVKYIDEYELVNSLGEKLYANMKKEMFEGKIDSAIKIAKILKNFPNYRDEVRRLIDEYGKR